MALVGISIWLASAFLAYFIAEVTVLCCDRTQWDHTGRVAIGVYCLILGPIALIIFLEMLILAEGGKEIEHHRMHLRLR